MQYVSQSLHVLGFLWRTPATSFHFSINIGTWVLFSGRSDGRGVVSELSLLFLSRKRSRDHVVHGWPFRVSMEKAAYLIPRIKGITWTRSLVKFFSAGKLSIETSVFLNPKAKQP